MIPQQLEQQPQAQSIQAKEANWGGVVGGNLSFSTSVAESDVVSSFRIRPISFRIWR